MTPDSLASLSDSLFSITVALYSLAVVAFCAQLAFGRRPARTPNWSAPAAPAAPAPAGRTRRRRGRPRAPLGRRRHGPHRRSARSPTPASWSPAGWRPTGCPGATCTSSRRRPCSSRSSPTSCSPSARPALRHLGLFVLAPGRARPGADRPVPLRRGRPAGGRAAVVLAGHPRDHGDHRLRDLLRQRDRQRAVPGPLAVRGPGGRRRGAGVGHRRRGCPAAAALDRVAHRTAVFGFPIWTFAVIAGAIWAEAAWGRFWGWDPKETWAFIAWVVYAAYLHARTTAGWRGRPPPG